MANIAETAIINPAVSLGNSVITYLPGLIAALITVVIGYFVGLLVGTLLRKGLEKTKLQDWLKKSGRDKSLGGLNAPRIIGSLVKWWIFIAFLSPAAGLIMLTPLANMLAAVAQWLPHLLAGIIIMIVGVVLADFAADKISVAKKMKGVGAIGTIVKVSIVVFFLSISLKEIGIKVTLAETSLLIVITGVVLALSLAIGISFGFALRKHADKMLTNFFKKI